MKLKKKNIIKMIHNPYKYFLNNDDEDFEEANTEDKKEGEIQETKVNDKKDDDVAKLIKLDELPNSKKFELAKKNQELVKNTKDVN